MVPHNKIHAVYFSSGTHFQYLLLSLKSLTRLDSPYLGNISVYIDIHDPLSEDQKLILWRISHQIQIRATHNIVGTGKDYIISEIIAFQEVSQEIHSHDYVMKVDSDIIFLDDDIFYQVLISSNILVGHKEDRRPHFPYIQWWCYFMRADSTPKLAELTEDILYEVARKIHPDKQEFSLYSYPEDAVIHSLFKKKTDKILFVSFMNFYSPILRKKSEKNCLVHFTKTKYLMWIYFYWGEVLCNSIHTLLLPWNISLRLRKYIKRYTKTIQKS